MKLATVLFSGSVAAVAIARAGLAGCGATAPAPTPATATTASTTARSRAAFGRPSTLRDLKGGTRTFIVSARVSAAIMIWRPPGPSRPRQAEPAWPPTQSTTTWNGASARACASGSPCV